jgi:hypothetical protein
VLHIGDRRLQLLHLLGQHLHGAWALISVRIVLVGKHHVTFPWTLLLLLSARRLALALLPIQLLCNLSFFRLMLLVTLSACMTRHSTHVAEELLLGFP